MTVTFLARGKQNTVPPNDQSIPTVQSPIPAPLFLLTGFIVRQLNAHLLLESIVILNK